MRNIFLTGFSLLVFNSCSDKNIPNFEPIQNNRQEQDSTLCYETYSLEKKVEIAQNLINEIAQHELKYDTILRAKDYSECEALLIRTLIQYKMRQPDYKEMLSQKYVSSYDVSDQLWRKIIDDQKSYIQLRAATSAD